MRGRVGVDQNENYNTANLSAPGISRDRNSDRKGVVGRLRITIVPVAFRIIRQLVAATCTRAELPTV